MKKINFLLVFFLIFSIISEAQVIVQRVTLENNIKAYFQNTGIFDQNTTSGNLSGFEWPIGSGKNAIFTTGLTIAGYINGVYCMASASYKGEYGPGKCNSGIPYTDSTFKIYKVKIGDNYLNNPDWLNWGRMVPYGAPFIDANNNGTYEPMIDTPGVRKASQTIFMCLTDGFDSSHSSGEGFGGGTSPMFSEMHMTAWCYDKPELGDVQFVKWDIINKSTYAWDSTIFSVICDPDLGYANDDYIGVDTSKKLGYCYNGTNNDQVYGPAPPAVGIILLKGAVRKNVTPNINVALSSYDFFTNTSVAPPPCESDPNGEPYPAYLLMSGFKKDSTAFLDPGTGSPPYSQTKFVYPGDPETNNGWTETQGSIQNCYGELTGTYVHPNPVGDRRFCLNSGKVKVNAIDTQTIIIAQLIRKGSSNKNSVTLLKQFADSIIAFYNNGFTIGITNLSKVVPKEFRLFQNYPNPFNPVTNIKFDIVKAGIVNLKVYDVQGREISILVNDNLSPGTYETTWDASALPSGIYFYRLQTKDFSGSKRMILVK